MAEYTRPTPLKIRTRYQRMSLAGRLARKLEEHEDPYVQGMGQAIAYTLSAPMSTLNNVLDQFPAEALVIVRGMLKESPNGR